MEIEATTVFEDIWNAINATTESGERKYRYIILEGSSRSSKTTSMIDAYDLYARLYENKRLTIWRDTKIDCKQTVLNDQKKHIKRTNRWEDGFRFQKTESVFMYTTDSTIEIHGTDDDEKVHGLTQDAAWFNEPYKIGRDTFDQIDQRTSDFVVLDWNPKKMHFIDDLKKDPRAIVLHSTFKNNPFCPPEQRRKLLSYQPVKMCEAVIQGLKTENQIFEGDIDDLDMDMFEEAVRCVENHNKNTADAYKWSVYGLGLKAEKPNRIFNWDYVADRVFHELNASTELYVVDWGTVDPWAITRLKLYDGAIYAHELNYKSENELRAEMNPQELHALQMDPEGLVKKRFLQIGIPYDAVIVCDSNRPNKIRALRQIGYEYALAAVKGPIMDGIDLLLSMKVYYTKSSANIEYEQENYSYKVDRYGVKQEEPEDLDNHLMDCIRYGAEYFRKEGYITKV